MTEADTRLQNMLNEAYRIFSTAITRTTAGTLLNRDEAVWLIPDGVWTELEKTTSFSLAVDVYRRQLFGLPVRITIDDANPTAPYMIVMQAAQAVRTMHKAPAPAPYPPRGAPANVKTGTI